MTTTVVARLDDSDLDVGCIASVSSINCGNYSGDFKFKALWCVCGGFNAVHRAEERKGCCFDPGKAVDFDQVIFGADLKEVELGANQAGSFSIIKRAARCLDCDCR